MSTRITKAQVRLGYSSQIHDFGTGFDKPPTVEEALTKIGGNFEIEKVQTQYNGNDVPGHFWTVRKDTNQVLGHVGKKYSIIAPKAGFDILSEIGGDITIDKASVLGHGERMFMTCKLPTTTKIAGDLIEHYFVIFLSHDGNSSLLLILSPRRPACWNVVNLMIKTAPRKTFIRHTANYEARIKEAARILGITKDYFTRFPQLVQSLVDVHYPKRKFEKLAENILHKPDKDADKRKITAFENAYELLMNAYNVPNLENLKDTGWKAYNAVVDYSDHMRQSRGDDEAKKAASAFLRTLETGTANHPTLKDQAQVLILAAR